MAPTKGVTLYTAGTPNGWKASIVIEELKIPYEARAISLFKNEQKEDWFTKINPNGRIPAIGQRTLENELRLTCLIRACYALLDMRC